jgi:hypothetical protein
MLAVGFIMNLIDFFVTEIVSEPYFEYNKWWVKVKANGYGVVSNHELMFDTKEQCLNVTVGYKFLA